MQIHANHLVNHYQKKNPAQILIGIILTLQINLGRTDILGTVHLLTHKHGISFILFRSFKISLIYIL